MSVFRKIRFFQSYGGFCSIFRGMIILRKNKMYVNIDRG